MRALLIPLLFVLQGCTVELKATEEDRDKVVNCTDTRTGENFRVIGKDVTLIRRTGGPDLVTLTDTDGKKRVIPLDEEPFFNCVEVTS